MSHELWALVGVIIGGAIASFTPLISYRLERRKRKKDIKKELIQSIYEFFSHLKSLKKFQGEHYFYNIRGNRVSEVIKTWPKDHNYDNAVKDMESDWSLGNKIAEQIHVIANETFRLESRIHALLIDTEDHYGEEIYRSVRRIIDPEISKSNSTYYIKDFDKMKMWSLDDFIKNQVDFNDNTILSGIEIQNVCDQVIKKLLTILK